MRSLTTDELRAQKPDRHDFASLPRNPFAVVLDNLTSGFNVGSVFRVSDTFLADRLYLCGTTPVPPRSAIARTSMGTDRWVPWERHAEASHVVTALKERGHQIVVVELTDESTSPEAAEYRPPLALVMGDEMLGVSSAIVGAADIAVAVPMLGMGNSLSVVSAFAIVAYELTKTLLFRIDPERAAAQLRLLRLRRGWSMRELGERTGVHFTTISDIENGHHRPATATVRRLVRALLPTATP